MGVYPRGIERRPLVLKIMSEPSNNEIMPTPTDAAVSHHRPALQRLAGWLGAHSLAVELLLLALIVLLAGALRAFHLGYKSFWLDEVTYVRSAQLGPLFGPYGYASISHPPGYLLPLRLMGAANPAEWFLRLPAMVSGVAAVVALWALGRKLLGRAEGLLAAFLLALSSLHLEYSQEAHSYALFALLSTLLLLTLVIAAGREMAAAGSFDRRLGRWLATWLGFIVVSTLALYIHYYAIAPVGLSLLVFPCFLLAASPGPVSSLWRDPARRRALINLIIALAIIALLFLPQVVSQLTGSAATAAARAGAIETGSLERGFTFSLGTFGDTVLAFITNRTPWTADPLFVPAVAGLWLAGLVWLLLRRRAVGAAFLLWMLLPLPLLAWFAFQTGFSFAPRRLIFILPVFLLTVAVGMTAVARLVGNLVLRFIPDRRALGRAATAVTLTVLVLAFVKGSLDPLSSYYRKPKQDWRTLATILQTAARPGDAVVILPNAVAPLDWYYKNPAARFISDGLTGKLDELCASSRDVYVASATTGKQPSADEEAYLAANYIRVPLKELTLYYRNCQPGVWYGAGAEQLYRLATDPFLSFNPVRTSLKAYQEAAELAAALPPEPVTTPAPAATATPESQPTAAATEAPEQPQATATLAPTATPPSEPLPDPVADLGAYLAAAVQQQPDSAAALTRLGAYLVQSGELDRAVDRFNRATTLDPAESLAYNLWIQTLLLAGQIEDAQTVLANGQAALPDDPGLAIIAAGLAGNVPASAPSADLQGALDSGRAALSAGDAAEAVAQGRRAVALESNRYDGYLVLGDGYRALGELGQALAAYQRATALAPQLSFLHARQGEVLARQGRVEDALEAGLNAVSIDETRWENWLALGRAYAAAAQDDPAAVELARSALQQSIDLAPPENLAPRRALDELLAAAGQQQESTTPPAASATGTPVLSPAARRAQAEVALRSGRAEDALAAFQSLVETDSNDTASRMGVAASLAALNRVDEALAAYEQISADQPDFPFAHIKRGELLEQQQDMDAALDAFRTAAEIAPENADVQFTLAYALRRAGLTDEAIAAFEAGLALDPGRQAAQDALDALRAGS